MIAIERVSKAFAGVAALTDCTLTIERGAFFVLLGPSGCGKSTLLRTINGLISPDSGRVLVRGCDVATMPPDPFRRGIGYVIQSVGLFPHWTIADNIRTVPRLLGWDRERIAKRFEEIVALLGVDPALFHRYPHQLSGGQRQRVGVARALAANPDLLLMDEPFSALDPVSRAAMQTEMRRIHAAGTTTIVMVTHDVDEALRLATQIALMEAGRIVQTGTPAAVIGSPTTQNVAVFLGGSERALHRLDVILVRDRMRPGSGTDHPRIAADATLRAALALMLETASTTLTVTNEDDRPIGLLPLQNLVMDDADG